MARRLTRELISRESENRDAASTTALHLSHRALSDVSCLSDFRNLEKLDLSSNCLSTLEGLSSCINLKWLSVVENKVRSLRGIEGLSKLTVLNAGKNKLQRMDEVSSLTNLRALILNDNEIAHICRLDQLNNLNTLVLSRNPIQNIGDSLVKVKSITKLSLSNCEIEMIVSSLASCVDLKEVRLAHNKITTLPAELVRNVKLQNLDLGNNLIENWSEIKVVASLDNLRNLNLQGNPIAEKDKFVKKIKRLLPNLRVFNAKPIERVSITEISSEDMSRLKDDSSFHSASAKKMETDTKRKMSKGNIKLSEGKMSRNTSEDDPELAISTTVDMEKVKKRKKERRNTEDPHEKSPADLKPANAFKKKKKHVDEELQNYATAKDSKRKESTASGSENPPLESIKMKAAKKSKRNLLNQEGRKFEGIDNVEMSFLDLIVSNKNSGEENHELISDEDDTLVVQKAKKKKKAKSIGRGGVALQLLGPPSEIGMGGPSTWDD